MNEQKDKKSLDELISHAIDGQIFEFDLNAWKEHHQQDIQEFKARTKGQRIPNRAAIDICRTIMRSRTTKFAAAAVVLVAFLIGLRYWLPSEEEKIKIPAELAAMPPEELLEIHFGRRESAFGSELVRAATDRALGRLSAREIIAMVKRFEPRTQDRGRLRGAAIQRARGRPKQISAVVEAADLIVRARVNRVVLDASELRAAILKKDVMQEWRWQNFESWMPRIGGTVELDVRGWYPPSAMAEGEQLVVHTVFSTRRLGFLEEGREYLLALKQERETIRLLRDQEGVYVVDSNSGMVHGLRYGLMALDEAWEFIMDAYDAIHEGTLPSGQTLDYWLAKFQSDDLIDCWTAVEYFSTLVRYCWLAKLQSYEIVDYWMAVEYLNTLAQPPVAPEAVAEAMERQVRMRAKYTTGHGWRQFRNERNRRSGFVKDAFDLLIKLGDPNTNERMVELYKRERVLDDSIFSEHAAGNYHGIVYRVRQLVPSASPQAEKSLQAVLKVVKSHLTVEDNEFIPFLAEILTRHSQVPRLIAARIPDPCFVPVLREAIEHKYSGDLVWALYACGQEEEAVGIASEHVRDYLNDPNTKELSPAQHYSMWRTIRFLGISGSEAAADLIEALTYGDVFRGPRGNRLQAAAIMAFARVAGDRAIQPLRELYATDDCYIRIAAAVSLYYLGDDSGYDLLEHFIKHTERSVPEIEKLWGVWMWNLDTRWGRPFHEALLYLRSPQTEELFLERLRNGVRKADMQALTIAREREREVLPILVEHLNSRNRVTRDDANEMLKRLTGQDFGYSPWRYPLASKQTEAVERWCAYVDEYLAEGADPAE